MQLRAQPAVPCTTLHVVSPEQGSDGLSLFFGIANSANSASGQQDSEVLAALAWYPKFDFRNTHKGQENKTLPSCPLTSTRVLRKARPHIHPTHEYIEKD